MARPEEIVGAIDIAKSSGAAALNVLAALLRLSVCLRYFSPRKLRSTALSPSALDLINSIEAFRLANWLCWRVEHE